MCNTILIVDDDRCVNGLLREIFTKEGYEVISAYDGEEAIRILEKNSEIPLMLLDVMLPVMNGWQVLDYVKSRFNVKVIMLTALSDEDSEAKGLRNGADDYVYKPFRNQVLVERVRRLINASANKKAVDLVCGNLRVVQNEVKVYIGKQEVEMTTKEYQLLLFLMKNRPNVLTREVILERVWGMNIMEMIVPLTHILKH